MYAVIFKSFSKEETKLFKTQKNAIKCFNKYVGNMGFWVNISIEQIDNDSEDITDSDDEEI